MASCTILNVTGDVTISWDDKNNEDIKKWIASKMEEGCTFFVLEKKFGFISKKKKVNNISQLPKNKKVLMSDKDFLNSDKIELKKKESNNNLIFGDLGAEKLVINGHAKATPKEKDTSNKVIKIAEDVIDVMSSDTMCTNRMMGG